LVAPPAVVLELDTAYGPARAHVQQVSEPLGSLVLGHGAGGGVQAPDLIATARAAHDAGWTAVRVEQPYRVAGRRSPGPAAQLDRAWLDALGQLRARDLLPGRLVVGGRSAGARVACRTAATVEAHAVLGLAFPMHPPGRADDPSKSRLPELQSVHVPVLIIQGERDPFGRPPAAPGRDVVLVPGTHSLRADREIGQAVARWLAGDFSLS
jgi:predicted alpha/beta-hydrolase family hydrolase